MTQTPDKIVYTAVATAVGGRRGSARTPDGTLDLTLTAPVETGGDGSGTNPEELFALGYAACFAGAAKLAAKNLGVELSGEPRVTANVGFGPEGESFAITVDLEVELPGIDTGTAQKVTDAAHQLCPYSKATRGNVPVTVTAVTA